MDEFIGEFIVETQEGLNALDTALVTFAAQPDDKPLLDRIFRNLHTIKGTCGFLGLARLEKLAHIAETLLDGFRKGDRKATAADVRLILQALDQIRFLVDAIGQDGQEPAGADDLLIAALQDAIDGVAEPAPANPPAETPAVNAQDINKSADPGAFADAAMPVVTGNSAPPAIPSVPAAAAGTDASSYLRLHVDRLEEMLTMVSELVLTRNQISQIVRQQPHDALEEPLQRLDSVVSDLQAVVMTARMQPIGNGWVKFSRIIHDIAHQTGKSIQLVKTGEDTAVDRQVLELIKDPLLHMVRNAADHGIEMPDIRRAAGKNETGTVNLAARHERGYIVIEISDDGKGLSADRIRDTVLARGLATASQLEGMSRQQLFSYIFAPGFSTAEKVTSISGRGVGMDVVRTNIEKMGGTIALDSAEGKGSCFTIRIPLTLAIIPALLLLAGGQRYALPQLTVQELIRIRPDSTEKIENVGGIPVLRLRSYTLPLLNLGGLLANEDAFAVPLACYVIVVQSGTLRYGLIVDEIAGSEEIVVKPVPAALHNISLFSGNTILGDGGVVLILDPAGIAARTGIAAYNGPDRGTTDLPESSLPAIDKTALLLFRSGDDTPKAVPAFLVSRIAEIPRAALERTGDKIVTQYQNRLITVHMLDAIPDRETIKVLIFSDDYADRIFGLAVDAVDDIVFSDFDIDADGGRPGFLGAAIVAGRATAILDINYFTGDGGWTPAPARPARMGDKKRVLLVDDSAFFRHMLQPLLSLAGYTVTVVPGPKTALALCEKGADFDMIVSDIEMDEMDGLTFAETVRGGTRWKDIPLVALSARATPQDKEKGYQKGFSAYVAKSDRDALLSTLRAVFEQSHGRKEDL